MITAATTTIIILIMMIMIMMMVMVVVMMMMTMIMIKMTRMMRNNRFHLNNIFRHQRYPHSAMIARLRTGNASQTSV